MTPIDYGDWAGRYDKTRGASPSVLSILLHAFGDPAGLTLLDIGGGTGNFAQPLLDIGFDVSLCDATPEMVAKAKAKLPALPLHAIADGQRLPFRDGSFDCALSVNVLSHMPDWRAGLAEARRVIGDGPFVLKFSTAETQKSNWVLEYLPQLAALTPPSSNYRPEAETLEGLHTAGFTDVKIERVYYRDTVDGSFQALKWFPDRLLEDDHALNTAAFMRVPANEAHIALEKMRADHASGRLAEIIARYEESHKKYGDGTVFICRP
jgi:ubiquinone/menaquinone biosynthesis C-methylase UbiE